jgi:outer membrane autotransporter protein
VALGYDHYFDNDILGGLAFSLAWPTSKSTGMKNKATSWLLSGYGGYELPGQVELGVAVGLGQSRYELSRWVRNNYSAADYDSRTLRAGLSLGRPIDLTPSLSLRPRLLADYLNIKVDGYKETAGKFSLGREGSSQDLWRTELLAELVWQSETGASVGGSLGWARLYGDRETSVQSFFIADAPDYNFFDSGTPLDRDNLTVGLNASLPIADSWAIEADYNGIFGRSTDSHSGELKAVFSF